MAEPQQQSSRAATVTVACKYPPGVILRLHHKAKRSEPTQAGFRDFEIFEPNPKVAPIEIAGPGGVPFGQGVLPGKLVTPDGFALTPGVPKDVWDAWCEQNADHELLVNKLLFARSTDVESMAREHAAVKTGVEPTDPDNPSARIGRLRGMQATKDDGK